MAESNLVAVLEGAFLSATFGTTGTTEVDGVWRPENPLAAADAPIAEIEASLDARYGAGMAKTAPGATHSTVDLSPWYVANGIPFPITRTDREDLVRVKGAVDVMMKAIADLHTGAPPSIVASVTSLAKSVSDLTVKVDALVVKVG